MAKIKARLSITLGERFSVIAANTLIKHISLEDRKHQCVYLIECETEKEYYDMRKWTEEEWKSNLPSLPKDIL